MRTTGSYDWDDYWMFYVVVEHEGKLYYAHMGHVLLEAWAAFDRQIERCPEHVRLYHGMELIKEHSSTPTPGGPAP